ncbi:hypothetical protein [Bacillus pumilus]|nr:hypothetical protein [Bacillus pumilus]
MEHNIFRLGMMGILMLVLGSVFMELNNEFPNVLNNIENYIEHVTGDMH